MKNQWDGVLDKLKKGAVSPDEAALGLDPSKYKKLPNNIQKFGSQKPSNEEVDAEVVPLEDLQNQYLKMLGGSAMERADAYRMQKALPKPSYDKLEKGVITDDEIESMYQGY